MKISDFRFQISDLRVAKLTADKGQKAEGGSPEATEADNLQSAICNLQSEAGIALMMVLWILALLGMIALNYSNSNRWNSASTRNLKEETVSYYLAMSGYQEAVGYIMSDKDPSFDLMDGEGNFWVDKETQPITGKRSTEEGEIEIKIIDEDSKININFAKEARLTRLFEYAGVPQDEITGITDSILDWIDTGDAHHIEGAEDEYYEELPDPYKAKNAFLDIPEELILVKGISPEYIYGSEEVKSLLPIITTFGNKGDININTASKEVMEILGLDPVDIEYILDTRNIDTEDVSETEESQGPGGFKFIPPHLVKYVNNGLNAVSSNNLRIEVIATANNSKMTARVEAVLNRKKSTQGYKIQTVYWRESAENIRTQF